MIDLRIYRAAFLPTLVAIVVLMFSVDPAPPAEHLPPGGVAVGFDARRAAHMASDIAAASPSREPGSPGDATTADEVQSQLSTIPSGEVATQPYAASFDGNDVTLRNVILTLPGTSDRAVVVVANRDTIEGPDTISTASATGALVQLAQGFGRARHQRTLVFISTDGGSDGASGIRRFLDSYSTPELIDAIVVLQQPGTPGPAEPHVIATSTGPNSSSAQLVQTAKAAVENAGGSGAHAELPGLLGSLFSLALPSGMTQAAPAIDRGVDAVAVSGAGERPLHGSAEPDVKTITEYGDAVRAIVIALDAAPAELIHGPDAQLRLGGNVIPGWAIAILTLTLLLPPAIVAVDGLARASRRRDPVLAAELWAASRALPFLVPVVLAYLLGAVGIAPAPDFPFDPARYDFGWRAAAVLVVLIASFVAALLTLHAMRVPRRVGREALSPALGAASALAVGGVWLVNPYLALLLVPFAHVWILGARPSFPVSAPGTIVAALLAAIPLAAAVVWLVGRLDLGVGAPWQLLLMMTGGQIPVPVMLLGCLLAGSILGSVALARSASAAPWGEAPIGG